VLKISLLPKASPAPPSSLSTIWERLWETEPPVFPLRLYPSGPWPKVRRFTPAFLTSALIQASLIFFLYSFPFALIMAWLMGPEPVKLSAHTNLEVVKLHDFNLADYLPNIKPKGAAKAPGRAPKRGSHPKLGSSHFDPRITIVSNPPHPDNALLTLKNETVPRSPKPIAELQVPDVVAGGPKPKPEAAKSPAPAPEKVNPPAPPVAPPVEPPPPPPPPKPLKDPSLMAPVTPHVSLAPSLPPPPVQFAAKLPDLPTPHLEVPLPPPPAKPAPPPAPAPDSAPPQPAPAEAAQPAVKGSAESPSGGKATPAAASGQQDPGGGPQILSLSVNPIPLKDLAAIPGGVHNGEFTISPAGTLRGSPGGTPGGSPEEGEGGPGPGGDKSVAVGNGKGKPGGGGQGDPGANPSASPSVSISGPGGGAGISAGTLPPLKPADLVYPVKPDTPKAHAPTMVVSGGSFGGGGLRVFGVLHGGKIYTVYFPMPGKNWILQYCAQEAPLAQNPNTRVVTIQMAPPLTPPAAIDEFDFHRPPQQPGAANSMIILHGNIQADGSVNSLSIIQGLDSISNDAAMIAFARWKFKPSMRLGTPVPVEILIGIP
jgi:hypothetical protein